ncbi:MAG: cytochrome c3 family protein [Deltaproteobacteria bacterium]|nr:cytochrome c3 family protein [Deltaproteobacteria bacterium]MBW2121375.1 cytochrome c3 family protein [Deltaproteobacteria bacterium]
MKKVNLGVLVVAGVSLLLFGVLWAQPDVLTLKSKKGDVTFPHKAHTASYACVDCHHKTKTGETPKSCAECHKKGATVSAMKAFHSKTSPHSCRGCHTKEGKGPKYTPCSNCHKK